MRLTTSALAVSALLSTSVMAAEPTNEELLEILKKQQQQIEELKKSLDKTDKKVEETDQKVESSADAIEQSMTASTSNTQIGGYGELHYNNIEDSESIDFHRFVLFFGHEFTDSIRFFSELELEHALSGDGKPGEVELEQAYIEMDLTEQTKLKSGVFLIPVGIINETHEPPTFYGVERNPIEKNIIPATWWEAGAGLTTQFGEGVNADFAIHSGLNVDITGSNSFLIRNGRQKVAKANADSLAYTARLKYTAIPGLELAASFQHQSDVTQGELDSSASLFSSHVAYTTGNFGIRALYASWDIDGSDAESIGRDSQEGYYVEPSYKINQQFGLFARYNAWDNNAGDSADTEKRQTNIGLNYWPHENVVFKVDIENRTGAQDGSGFNLGVGYQF
jgi:hypothetical protein